MPFKGSEARVKVNRLVYPYNGQKLVVKYNAGDKYAELEEKIDSEKLDEIGENGNEDITIPELRRKLADLLCIVIEEWDYEDDDGKVLPITGKALADERHPLEFYSGLSSAISEDFASRGGGTKSRS